MVISNKLPAHSATFVLHQRECELTEQNFLCVMNEYTCTDGGEWRSADQFDYTIESTRYLFISYLMHFIVE